MKADKKATSIVEAMVVLLIVVTWIVWLYQLFTESQKLSNSTQQRILAIQIAREWIEGIINIRDTNWILYAADYPNCWNTLNYNSNCIGSGALSTDILHSRSFTIYQNSDNKWYLDQKSNNETRAYSSIPYRAAYRVKKDINGFYTQTGWVDFLPEFTREMKIIYQDTNGGAINSNDEKMWIQSIVQWNDGTTGTIKKVELETVLTNWKY